MHDAQPRACGGHSDGCGYRPLTPAASAKWRKVTGHRSTHRSPSPARPLWNGRGCRTRYAATRQPRRSPPPTPLIDAQAQIGFAQAPGGRPGAATDGIRFAVLSLSTRPDRGHFGAGRGPTRLNLINDQGTGLGALVVTGTGRDSLRLIDAPFRRAGGHRPEVIATDTDSPSGVVFGRVHLPGMQHRPAPADLPGRSRDEHRGDIERVAEPGPGSAPVPAGRWGDRRAVGRRAGRSGGERGRPRPKASPMNSPPAAGGGSRPRGVTAGQATGSCRSASRWGGRR